MNTIQTSMGILLTGMASWAAWQNPLVADDQGKWEILFDGSSTQHFRGYQRDAFPTGAWKIEQGALRSVVGGDEVDLVTKRAYRNFELVFEWKVSRGANSGVLYRVSEAYRRPWQTGPEYQILDDPEKVDPKDRAATAGSLYALLSPQNKTLRPTGQYNHSRIVVSGDRVEHWLNGEKIVACQLGSEGLKTLISKSKFADQPRFAKIDRGPICFQHHHSEVWFKQIKIRGLPSPPDVASNWITLFDGESTENWRGFLKDSFPAKGWVVDHQSLRHLPRGGGGSIISRRSFSEFDLRWQWKVAPGANSGVKYFILEKRKRTIGHEYQIIDDGRHPDALRGTLYQTGSFYDVLSARNKVLKDVGEFNDSRILVKGNKVEHWLNGIMVLRYTLGSDRVLKAISRSKFRKVEGFGFRQQGPILLQDHGDEVWYRNIRIRDLSSHS